MNIIRVFPTKTKLTPTDPLAFSPPFKEIPLLENIDEVHISVTFLWDTKTGYELKRKWNNIYPGKVKIGGPAFGDPGGECIPGKYLSGGAIITSRGCPNKCPHCLVPERSGSLREYKIYPGNNIVDDNLLACSRQHIERVFGMLQGQKKVQFTGGLDARLLRPWHVELLKSISLYQMFFAADTNDFGPITRAANLLRDFSRNKKRCFVLIGYNGETPKQAELRLKRVWYLGFLPFAQFYRGKGEQEKTQEWKDLQRTWSRPPGTKAFMKTREGGEH